MKARAARRLVTAAAATLVLTQASHAQPPAPADLLAEADRAAATQDPRTLAACLARFAVVGLPAHRSEEALNQQVRPVICRPGYALSFNASTETPDWVIERLTPAMLRGSASRRDNFQKDPLLAGLSPAPDDYLRSGYDRGHQAPAGNARFDQRVMDDSFRMSNMAPQVGIGFNRGQWKYLEEAIRASVLCGGRTDVVVITGPIYGASAKSIAGGRIMVPAAFYKIVYDVTLRRAVGFRLDNRAYRKTDLQAFVVPISRIEDDTGLDFFPNLSRRRQNQLETPKGMVWGHDQACANVGE